MTTTTEFKTRHRLSDSAFKRLVNKAKALHPDLSPFTVRQGATAWFVNHEQALEALLETTLDTPQAVSYPPTPQNNAAALNNTLMSIQRKRQPEVIECELIDEPTDSAALTIRNTNSAIKRQTQEITQLDSLIVASLSALDDRRGAIEQSRTVEDANTRALRVKAAVLDEIAIQAEMERARQAVAERFKQHHDSQTVERSANAVNNTL